MSFLWTHARFLESLGVCPWREQREEPHLRLDLVAGDGIFENVAGLDVRRIRR